MRASVSTLERQRFGTRLESSLRCVMCWRESQEFKTKQPKCGRDLDQESPSTNKGSRFWDGQWGTQISWPDSVLFDRIPLVE